MRALPWSFMTNTATVAWEIDQLQRTSATAFKRNANSLVSVVVVLLRRPEIFHPPNAHLASAKSLLVQAQSGSRIKGSILRDLW
jgi:hypothetical protein